MKRSRWSILCTLFLAGCAANHFLVERARQAYDRQDYRQAFIRTLAPAKAGDAEAQYALGYMYYYGQGVVEDQSQAIHWLALSAAQGNNDAKKALYLIKKSK